MKWNCYRIGEVFSRFSSGKNITESRISDNDSFPVYGGNGVRGFTDSYNFDGECILIGRQGAKCGNVRYFKGKAYMSDHAIVGVSKNEHCARFLHVALSCLQLNRLSGQAAQPGLSVNMLKRQKILLPTLSIQEKISTILSAYDDLIENNNRRIKILEQMAENLYKEWFVRFRIPGYEQTEFENGIPKGWQICRMSEFCYVTDGTHDTPTPVDVGVPLITGKCICSGTIDFSLAYNISHTAHEKIKKRSGLTSGDILFSNIGTVGNCCIVDYDREFSVKNVIIFKPETRNQTEYLYYWMTNATMQEIFSAQTNGASQQFVGLTFMRNFKILVPTEEILTAFADKISIFTEHKRNLRKCNLNLTKQRDLLLPRLMSGKLEV